jgi:hypothetical protein
MLWEGSAIAYWYRMIAAGAAAVRAGFLYGRMRGCGQPATLRRSCQEAQDTFTTLRDSAVRVYGETDQADRAGAARAAGRVQQSLPLVDPQRLRGQSGQLRGYRDAEQAPVQIRRPGVHGGIFRDCAVHDYDAVRWVTGQEVTEVYAAGSRLAS